MRYISINLLDPREAQTIAACEDCGALVFDTIAHDADHARRDAPIPPDLASATIGKITEPVPPTLVTPLPKARATKATET